MLKYAVRLFTNKPGTWYVHRFAGTTADPRAALLFDTWNEAADMAAKYPNARAEAYTTAQPTLRKGVM